MSPIRRILAPVDFSEASASGLRYAESVAIQFGAELDILFVVEPPKYPSWGYSHLVLRDRELMEEAAVRMPEFVRQCGLQGTLVADALIRAGDADSEIIKAAADTSSDLIVMASHGLGGLKHSLIGSTTERVVRHAPCSVLTVRETALKDALPPYRKFHPARILVPTDLSEESLMACATASDLAARFGSSILALTVIADHMSTTFGELGYVFETRKAIEEARRDLPRAMAERIPGTIPRQTEVIEGSPAHVICEVARAQNLDLIVMNTHGRSGASHLLIGSVTERVVRNAPCSVWTFRKSPEPPARQGS